MKIRTRAGIGLTVIGWLVLLVAVVLSYLNAYVGAEFASIMSGGAIYDLENLDWSPDSSEIVFTIRSSHYSAIRYTTYRITIDSREIHIDEQPTLGTTWQDTSPDGAYRAIVSKRHLADVRGESLTATLTIDIADANGHNRRRVYPPVYIEWMRCPAYGSDDTLKGDLVVRLTNRSASEIPVTVSVESWADDYKHRPVTAPQQVTMPAQSSRDLTWAMESPSWWLRVRATVYYQDLYIPFTRQEHLITPPVKMLLRRRFPALTGIAFAAILLGPALILPRLWESRSTRRARIMIAVMGVYYAACVGLVLWMVL